MPDNPAATSLNLDQLLQRRLLMVGGKGGVGKSTVAASLAVAAANRGRKTLLISTDPAHNLSDLFECILGTKGPQQIPWAGSGLFAQELNPHAALDAYLESVRSQMLPHVAINLRPQLEKQLQLTRHSPGAEEAALLDEITRVIQRRHEYDLIIFDTAPTGHTLRLLSLPAVMCTWVDGLVSQKKRAERFRDVIGSLRIPRTSSPEREKPRNNLPPVLAPLLERQQRFRESAQVLCDPGATGFLFVMTAESLPLEETLRAAAALSEANIPIAGLVLNRLLPEEAEEVEFLRGAWALQQQVLAKVTAEFAHLPQLQLLMTGRTLQGRAGLDWLAKEVVAQSAAVADQPL
ncbi:ArsA family ATPase [Microbulbifer pacificus]|uniref:arsenite-transporting ATPase n=1 Tax=Microbulbifer pacificus TaxID=407164 RepID=A0AAU0N0J4_9GAMM|nr:ArsA family ATPase [Microbulbifer pacificus]WOX05773.1 ArsA family ATPase [Microbulbifer pacificus]